MSYSAFMTSVVDFPYMFILQCFIVLNRLCSNHFRCSLPMLFLCISPDIYSCLFASGDEESGSGSGSGFTTEPEVIHTEPPMLEADKSGPQPTAGAAHRQKPSLQLLVCVLALTALVLCWR